MKNENASFFEKLWRDYISITPDAKPIHDLIGQHGIVTNDHIAFRTFNKSPIALADFTTFLKNFGYKVAGNYTFVDKHLLSHHYEHESDPTQPKIFVSELVLEDCSEKLQKFCLSLLKHAQKIELPFCPWPKISYKDYQWLMAESEFAAWVSAFGLRANHFTVLVNALYAGSIKNIEQLNHLLTSQGFILNDKGGEVKGTVEEGLKQSSTMAKEITWEFADGTHPILSCYYEFAERFPGKQGSLYQGFITQSADKIFESTYRY